MRVLLLGATGNLGSHLLPALLANGHVVTALIRSHSKLASLTTPELRAHPDLTVVTGDATSTDDLAAALRTHRCTAIVNAAGNQVLPWREHLLPKIAAAVTQAALMVGAEQGPASPRLRAWFVGGMGDLAYPGTGWRLRDYIPAFGGEQHTGALRVLEATPLEKLAWSLVCVAQMTPEQAGPVDILTEPRPLGLLLQSGAPPNWVDHWLLSRLPLIGVYLNMYWAIVTRYHTRLEDVAGFVAGDVSAWERGNAGLAGDWVGKKVGIMQRPKAD